MEADTAFVRANGIVVLNTIASVCLIVALIVHPSNAECINTIWNTETLDEVDLVKLRVLVVLFLDCAENFFYCLMIFRLVRESALEILKNFFCVHNVLNFD